MQEDVAEVLIAPADLHRRTVELARQIEADYKGRDLVLICVLKGAIMFLVDFAVAEMAPPGEVAWQVAPQPSGGLGVTLTFPGRVYGQEECQRWLRPFQPGTTPPDHLGPGLAAAVARQHGGSLTITPQPGGGLALAFLLPGPIPAAAEG